MCAKIKLLQLIVTIRKLKEIVTQIHFLSVYTKEEDEEEKKTG